MPNAGKLGLVRDLAGFDEMVEADGEGHHLGDARQSAWRGLLWLGSGFHDGLGGSLAGLEFQFVRGS